MGEAEEWTEKEELKEAWQEQKAERLEIQSRRGLNQKLVGGTRAGPRRAFGELQMEEESEGQRRSLSKGGA